MQTLAGTNIPQFDDDNKVAFYYYLVMKMPAGSTTRLCVARITSDVYSHQDALYDYRYYYDKGCCKCHER